MFSPLSAFLPPAAGFNAEKERKKRGLEDNGACSIFLPPGAHSQITRVVKLKGDLRLKKKMQKYQRSVK